MFSMATAPLAGPLAACLQPVAGLPPPDLGLPALEPVKNRETYRVRPEDEQEEATWYSAEEPDTLVEPTKTRLRSIHSKQATVITFTNKSPFRVRALWIDFTGNEVVYSVLEPNTTRRYHTYQTHPWIVRELHTGTRMMLSGRPAVVGLAAEQTVEIAAPPQLQWSLDTFSCFPDPYTASIKGLLMAHKQLEAVAQQHDVLAAVTPLKALSVTPPCSPACAVAGGPCSPRATLAHQGALPTSPKAPRLTLTPVPASPSAAVGCRTPRTPRAVAVAGSPAGSGEASTSMTSISISSEASHFKATLTVSSPTRSVLQQTVNIEVYNNPAGSSASGTAATVNFGTQLAAASSSRVSMPVVGQGPRTGSAVASRGRDQSAGRRVTRPKNGLFNNLVHSFKHAFRPALRHVPDIDDTPDLPTTNQGPSTTHITLHLQQLLQGVAPEPDNMEVDEPEGAACSWPPVGTHLGNLPSHLLVNIAELAAPAAWQTMDQCPKGRPDILPILLACPPQTAEEQAAEQQQQEQQQQEQQQQENNNDQQDDVPPLI